MLNAYQKTKRQKPTTASRRGSVIMIVLWMIAIAALITSAVQISSYRQAGLGRESLDRVQARWAARTGVEHTIAVMAWHTQNPVDNDAFAMARDMEHVATGDITVNENPVAHWDIRHHARGRDWLGPMDEHSRLNVNSANVATLMLLDRMWMDIAAAIVEWIDPEFEDEGLTVGREYYRGLHPPYEMRKEPIQNIAELELVAGVWPRYLRGEDWNLNNRLDPNENDCGRSFPPDNCDGVLDAGWSALLTAHSVEGGATLSGLPRIHLAWATIEEVMERIDVNEEQAKALIRIGRNLDGRLDRLLVHPISHVNNSGEVRSEPFNEELEPLTDQQLRWVFAELTMHDPLDRKPGRMNINTVNRDILIPLLDLFGVDQAVAEEILYIRDSRPEGILSMLDLLEIPELTDETSTLQLLTDHFMTHSNVYTISSKGRSAATGLEVEIIATVDRSTVPVKILEYREQ